MGVGGISTWELVMVLVVVVLMFGTKNLRNVGSDIGGAIKGFKSAMRGAPNEKTAPNAAKNEQVDLGAFDFTAENVQEKKA